MKFDVGILGNQPVPMIVRQAQLAESLGYDTVWIADTHLVCRELWVTLTACVLATSRIRLGPGVTVPHTRHISVTASAMATLHEMAEGRLVLGIGTGGSSAGTMGLSVQQVARVATLEAMTGSLRRLLGRGTMRFDSGSEGGIAWLDRPRPVPIYVAGSGPRMLAAAGRLGDGAIVYSSVSPSILGPALRCVEEGALASGRSLDDLDVAVWAPTSLGRDRALARDHVRGRVASALRHAFPVEFSAEDRAAIQRVREQYDSFQHATAGSTHRTLVPDRFVDLMALAGTPGEVVEQVRGIATLPAIDRVIVLPQVPGEGFIERESILQLFAEEVIARV
ncbi:MAG: LLM class flavin-dependent oxidoreductase [Candidatus Rokubacteria bacterium]|nr:LLM class flavin-dependent oxidoreductase [Candidatus Rokubacteria bacterium]